MPEIVNDEELPSLNVSDPGVFDPVSGTVICWSGTLGMPGLKTPTRYVPGITLTEKVPTVFVMPPEPKPRSPELPPPEVVFDVGRAKTPAFDTALLPESSTEPVMVLLAEVSVKFTLVTFVVVAITVWFGGGMKVKVGGGGGGPPGMK